MRVIFNNGGCRGWVIGWLDDWMIGCLDDLTLLG